MAENIEIGGRLHSVATGNVVTGANEILDDSLGKRQSDINAEVRESLGVGGTVDERIAAERERALEAEEQLRQAYGSLSQSQPVPVTELPATGEAGKIYRLAGESSYADYMYSEDDLATPIKMAEYDNAIDDEPTAGSDNLVKSGGIYDAIIQEEDFAIGKKWLDGGLALNSDIVAPTSVIEGNYQHAMIDVKEGEIYKIIAKGGTEIQKLWATTGKSTSSKYSVKRRSSNDDSTYAPQIITIEEGEDNLFVNNSVDNPIKLIVKYTDLIEYERQIDAVSNKTSENKTLILREKSIAYINEGYGINVAGSNINPDGHMVPGNFEYVVIDVNPGEQYAVFGVGGTYARLWAVSYRSSNSSWNSSRVADADMSALDQPIVITIADNENHLIVQNNTNNSLRAVYKIDDKTLQQQIIDANTEIDALEYKEIPLLDGFYTANSATTLGLRISNTGWSTRVCKVSVGDKFKFYGAGGTSVYQWATANKEGTILRRSEANISSSNEYELEIEENETLFIFNAQTNLPKRLLYFGNSIANVYIADSSSSSEDKAKADFVLPSGGNTGGNITRFAFDGVTVHLYAGTYTLTSAGNIQWVTGSKYVGEGVNINDVTLTRSSGYIFSAASVNEHSVEISNMRIMGSGIYFTVANKKFIITNVNIKDAYTIFSTLIWNGDGDYDITVGAGKNFADLLSAYTFEKDRVLTKIPTYHIYGHSIINGNSLSDTINLAETANYIGETDDAIVELNADKGGAPYFLIIDSDYATPNKSVFKNIRFLRTGEWDGWENFCVKVRSNYAKFYNCIFQNDTSTPIAYSGDTDPTGTGINEHGDRRHGIQVEPTLYGDACETEFHNCTGIGSPYGFKNCRGWYLYNGAPKLYNCVGIGGGIGMRGYGIVCHRESKAILYNCRGYGSPYGWKLCTGIQFQASATPTLFNCIGYGGCGYQHKSDGGRANYYSLSTLSPENHGFGMIFSASPRMINCIGYAGDGQDSVGLYMIQETSARIIGGYFGKEKLVYRNSFTKDSGHDYMTIPINTDRPISLTEVYVDDGANITYGAWKVQILDDTIVLAETIYNTQELMVPILNSTIGVGSNLRVQFVDAVTGDIVSAPDNCCRVILRYMVNNVMMCLYMSGKPTTIISDAEFEGNENSIGAYLALDNATPKFIVKNALFKTSGYGIDSFAEQDNAPFYDCKFTVAPSGKVISFKPTQTLIDSSNRLIDL